MDFCLPNNLLDAISVGICIVDKDYSVRLWNEYMEEYTGVRKDEIVNKTLFDFFPAFNKNIYRERIDSIFEGWPPVILSSRLHKPFFFSKNGDQQKRYQEISISPYLLPENENSLAIFTITDVTDLTNKLKEQNDLYKKAQHEIESRKKTQAKLKISENSLRELNATKDKFFSIIAHDLRGPFSALLGLSELLVRNSKERNFDQVVEFSQYIHEASESAYSLLVNLLDWSRLQLGKFTFMPEQISIEKIVDEVFDLFDNVAKEKGIILRKTVQPDIVLFADGNMISTIIRNLMSNAIKYSAPKSEVHIKVTSYKNELRVSVIDNGVGIRKEDIQKLFKVGSNFSLPGTAKETGTGLGLILCKEFVESHKGKIWVDSELGKGAVFSFSIPLDYRKI